MKDRVVKFVIIGYGHIGQRYALLLERQNSAALVALVDVQLASTNSPVPYFSTIDKLLAADIDFDIAIIATPNGLHAQHAIQCLKAGKDVVIEKPIALTAAGVEQLYQVAHSYNRRIFPVFQNRFAHTSLWLKELLGNGQLGQVFMVQVNCFWNRGGQYYSTGHWHGTKLLDGGTLFTQFSHFIDMLIWLFGPIKDVERKLFNFNHVQTEFEDSGIVTFGFEQGGEASLSFTTSVFDRNYESSLLIIAENGTVKVGGPYMDKLVFQHGRFDFPEMLEQTNSNHQLFLEDVVKRYVNNMPALVSEQEALATIRFIETVYKV